MRASPLELRNVALRNILDVALGFSAVVRVGCPSLAKQARPGHPNQIHMDGAFCASLQFVYRRDGSAAVSQTEVTAIIEAVDVEKSYPQADGTRIQVVGVTMLVIEPGNIVTLPWAVG